jgi:Fe-S cluster assembly ATP-binding protein
MLHIRNLSARVGETDILKGIDLQVQPGEVHAIMGPNASGKSTLAKVITGREEYEVTGGDVQYEGASLLDLAPEERARKGIFMSFQYPVEIAGITTGYFLRAAMNAGRKERGEEEIDAFDFLSLAKANMKLVDMSSDLLNRPINVGFSGGEKKRNEIFQMAMLQPKLAILDETDSGLDIDALRIVAEGVNKLRSPDRAIIVITHYQRLLDYLKPDYTHVLMLGKIVKSGGPELVGQLEDKGYQWVADEVGMEIRAQ